ncbi:MAG: DNA phosphorothioation system sulfurtransferase DndC [Mariprofundaceae bacterium]|nr:DNA phosphorothioation system sulfurtransferase DndC [Mariprofundaceae bacterium]
MGTSRKETQDHIRKQYLSDQRPWIVAYSGGKDSTLLLQLVYEMLLKLQAEGISLKPIHVISSDTLVEAPNVEDYLHSTLNILEQHAKTSSLPISVHRVTPEVSESFWSLLIGKGYPSPTRFFRWCTQRMKINPSKACIEAVAAKSGSVILLLGTRYDESSARKQSMQNRENNSRGFHPHKNIANALIFSPIAKWTTDEVWEYLFSNNPPPWGSSHDFMLKLYKQANGGECPLVLDINTPSCGGSRFGCWTCTVVSKDKSMQGFIETGEEWMRPLNEFRDWLQALRDKPGARLPYRRNGQPGIGAFAPEVRKEILHRLLMVEQQVGRVLISNDELSVIQYQWSKDFDPMQAVQGIIKQFGRSLTEAIITEGNMAHQTLNEQEMLARMADEHELPAQVIEELLSLVTIKYPSMLKRGSKIGLRDDVMRVIDNWVQSMEQAEVMEQKL